MCGPPRPSSGGRIAVLFPASPKASQTNSSSILFTNPDAAATRATFRGHAGLDLQSPIDLRIEKYGDLTSSPTYTAPPLHAFRLHPRPSTRSSRPGLGLGPGPEWEWECELPERLDLGISERGIVGRQVTVVAGGGDMGLGVVGFD